jgi:putative transcriptional regulator
MLNSLLQIGAVLQLSRKENALTQEQLADLANISERTVRAIETGTGNPSIGAVLSVASILGLKIMVQK